MYNLLLPQTLNWNAKVAFDSNHNWFEFIFSDDNRTDYFKYRVHLSSHSELLSVLEGIRDGMRYSFIPDVFFTEPYSMKIRQALGYTPNPYDFFPKKAA